MYETINGIKQTTHRDLYGVLFILYKLHILYKILQIVKLTI